VIEPEELAEQTGYTRPHTVHCMPGDDVVVSMLGDREGGGAGGFAVLDARTFEVKGRWENGGATPELGYDFWYQPRKNVLISSEFGEPIAYEPGFDIEDVAAGRYGQRLHFWDLAERRLVQTVDLGEAGLVPLEVRWLHDPDSEQGFVGATLASNIFRFHGADGAFTAEPVIEVENEELEGWPLPGGVPGLITDVVVSMDDRYLYFTNWLHEPAAIRHLRSRQPQADRPTLARWAARQAERRRSGPGRRTADDSAVVGRAEALRHQLALLELGQPVLPQASLLADASELRTQGRDAGRRRLLRRLPRPPRRSRASTRGTPPGWGLHDGDLPMMSLPVAHVGGIPIEEMLGSFGPALLLAAGVASAMLSARIRDLRARQRRRGAGRRRPSSVWGRRGR
jgi:56kDa selenium binding protein (SBP56)